MVTSGIHDRQYAPAENHVGKDVQNLNKGEIECNLWKGILAYRKNLEARVGFEPTDGGFADLSLRPLGYRAECKKYSETVVELSVANLRRNLQHSTNFIFK